MHLSIYVHDFHPQIGHTRAMLELINGLSSEQKNDIKSIEIVAFTSSNLDEIFNEFSCPKIFTQIPLPRLKPFILKMMFYHIITFFHAKTKGRFKKKIGIGIACLEVDIVNVQFVHEQWKEYFFKNRNLSILEFLYKKILFSYFSLAEKYIYQFKKNIEYIVIADFIKKFINQHFSTPLEKMTLIPSGVNSEEFKLIEQSDEEIFDGLIKKYPELKKIDIKKPIALFIGALERKGIYRVLESLKNIPDAQLIVIGRSENRQFQMPQLKYNIAHILFTKEISKFYQIADAFIFPTSYEPFGLVIIEAYAMGLDLFIPIENVGASEIIPKIEGINFFHQEEILIIKNLNKISLETKKMRRIKRLEEIKKYSWNKSALKFANRLFKI